MKRLIVGLLLVIILSSFVVSGSEISTSFVRTGESSNMVKYVPSESLWSNYGSYIIGMLVFLIIVLIIFKKKSKKKVKKIFKKKSKKKVKKIRKK